MPDPRGARAAGTGRDVVSAALVADLPAVFATTTFDPSDPVVAQVCASGVRRVVLRTDSLPVPMRREISWWLASSYQDGERVVDFRGWRRWVAAAAAVVADRPEFESFADLSLGEWSAAWARAFHADHGRLPAAPTRYRADSALRGLLPRLAVRYSDAPWWTHDVWCPRFDRRIPRRPHEPIGESSVRWDDIAPPWLSQGMTFHVHLLLESGQFTWSTVPEWHVVAARFSAFAVARGLDRPALVADPADLRPLALDFRAFLGEWCPETAGRGRERRPTLNARSIARTQRAVGNFYATMRDYRVEVAAATGDDRWLALSDSHARLYRPAELTADRAVRQADERNYISDTDLTRMMQVVELLGLPREQTVEFTRDGEQVQVRGLGAPAMMRVWLIQALTGRRASEVLLMDFAPLVEVPGLDPATVPDGGMVARLRYQQTKIDGAPLTVLVGANVVQIVREQQAWVRERWNLGPTGQVRYLFPRLAGNRHGNRPWETSYYDQVLRQFSEVVGLRDSAGQPILFSHSHRLRHTRATTTGFNLGAPIHVVQRYLGHRSPEMTMRYAATLATTAEREFLTLAKIGRDGREHTMDRRDMLDLLQLDRRTDRVPPNGYCLLPPVRSCDKGNACHGCDHFATDRTHLPEIRRQLTATEKLVDARQAQHTARYREPMSETNIWLEQRLTEMRSMRLEIAALETQTDDTTVVRGAGVLGRTGYQPAPARDADEPPTR